MGNMLNGNLNILNRDSDTNAVVASRTLFSSTKTYVAKVTSETYAHAEVRE